MYMYMYRYMYMYMYMHMHMHMHMYMCVYIYIYIYTYVCIYIYIYTRNSISYQTASAPGLGRRRASGLRDVGPIIITITQINKLNNTATQINDTNTQVIHTNICFARWNAKYGSTLQWRDGGRYGTILYDVWIEWRDKQQQTRAQSTAALLLLL